MTEQLSLSTTFVGFLAVISSKYFLPFSLCSLIMPVSDFLISSASVRSMPFLFFYCALLWMKRSLGISNVPEEVSSPSHSIVFLYFFVLITEETFLSLFTILWKSAFRCIYLSFSPLPLASLLFSAIWKASVDNHFEFWHFFYLGMVWSQPPVQCYGLCP